MSGDDVVQTRPDNNWHLDKRVNISMIVALAVQAIVAAIAFGGLFERVDALEAAQERQAGSYARLIAVEARIGRMESQLDRVEGKLDRAIEREGNP